jgi:hypothetical protein
VERQEWNPKARFSGRILHRFKVTYRIWTVFCILYRRDNTSAMTCAGKLCISISSHEGNPVPRVVDMTDVTAYYFMIWLYLLCLHSAANASQWHCHKNNNLFVSQKSHGKEDVGNVTFNYTNSTVKFLLSMRMC